MDDLDVVEALSEVERVVGAQPADTIHAFHALREELLRARRSEASLKRFREDVANAHKRLEERTP